MHIRGSLHYDRHQRNYISDCCQRKPLRRPLRGLSFYRLNSSPMLFEWHFCPFCAFLRTFHALARTRIVFTNSVSALWLFVISAFCLLTPHFAGRYNIYVHKETSLFVIVDYFY